jgi:hypothetical protein
MRRILAIAIILVICASNAALAKVTLPADGLRGSDRAPETAGGTRKAFFLIMNISTHPYIFFLASSAVEGC